MFRYLVICLLFSLLLLTCSSPKTNRITIWAHFDPPEKILVQKQIDLFASENPGWEFKLLTYSKQEIKNLYPISVIGKSGPSILYGFSSDIGQLAELNVLEPLETLFDSVFLSQFSSFPLNPLVKFKSLETGQIQLFQIADQIVNQQFLLVNRDLVTLPSDSTGQLSFYTYKNSLTDKGKINDNFPYDLVWDYTSPHFYYYFLSGSGGRIMDAYNEPQLNSQEGIQSLQVFRQFSQDGFRLPLESNLDQSRSWFRQRKAAMLIDGLFHVEEFKREGISVGIFSVSSLIKSDQTPKPLIYMKGFSVNPTIPAEKKKMSAKLIQFLCNKKNQLERTHVSFNMPTLNEALKDSAIQNNAVFKLMIDQVLRGMEMPVTPESSLILQELTSGYHNFLKDEKISSENSANNMQESALKLIKTIRK